MLKFDVSGVTSLHVGLPAALTVTLNVLAYAWYIIAPVLPLTPRLGSPALSLLNRADGAAQLVKTGAVVAAVADSGALIKARPAAARATAPSAAGMSGRRRATDR